MISNGITVGNATGLGASSASPSLSRSPKRWLSSPWHSSQSFGSMETRMSSYRYLIDTLILLPIVAILSIGGKGGDPQPARLSLGPPASPRRAAGCGTPHAVPRGVAVGRLLAPAKAPQSADPGVAASLAAGDGQASRARHPGAQAEKTTSGLALGGTWGAEVMVPGENEGGVSPPSRNSSS